MVKSDPNWKEIASMRMHEKMTVYDDGDIRVDILSLLNGYLYITRCRGGDSDSISTTFVSGRSDPPRGAQK